MDQYIKVEADFQIQNDGQKVKSQDGSPNLHDNSPNLHESSVSRL